MHTVGSEGENGSSPGLHPAGWAHGSRVHLTQGRKLYAKYSSAQESGRIPNVISDIYLCRHVLSRQATNNYPSGHSAVVLGRLFAAWHLSRSDSRQKVQVAVQHFEQFHQREWWLGLAVLIA